MGILAIYRQMDGKNIHAISYVVLFCGNVLEKWWNELQKRQNGQYCRNIFFGLIRFSIIFSVALAVLDLDISQG